MKREILQYDAQHWLIYGRELPAPTVHYTQLYTPNTHVEQTEKADSAAPGQDQSLLFWTLFAILKIRGSDIFKKQKKNKNKNHQHFSAWHYKGLIRL